MNAYSYITLGVLAIVTTVAAQQPVPGNSLFGKNNYIEYIPGDLPVVIAAPHGGNFRPSTIPDRTSGVLDSDAGTQQLARTIAAVIHAETGHHIHLVICRLHRSKLDANREVVEAAQGNPAAVIAWKEHHAFIERACKKAVDQYGAVFFIDLHGHAHKDSRVELGYMHSAQQLGGTDAALNTPAFVKTGSLELAVKRSGLPYVELLKGPRSFGGLLEANGFPSTPSPRMPVPTLPFFRGGYTVDRHCQADRKVAGLQIEANRPLLRDTPANRLAFAKALSRTLDSFMAAHLGLHVNGKKTSQAAEVPKNKGSADKKAASSP